MSFRHLFLLFAVAAFARATTVEPPSFAELVGEADSIYRGRVTSVQSRRVQAPGGASIIKTFVTFAVDRVLKGADQKEVVLEFLGGTVGDDTLEVGGMPRFNAGQNDILFVQKNGTQFCPLVRVMHGRYRVETNATTGQDYVARDNGVPLSDVSDVQLPLVDRTVGAARQIAGSGGLSVAAFELSIANEVQRGATQARIR